MSPKALHLFLQVAAMPPQIEDTWMDGEELATIDRDVAQLIKASIMQRDHWFILAQIERNIGREEPPKELDPWSITLLKIVENDLASMMFAKFQIEHTEFPKYHLGLGRSLIALTTMMHAGDIRSDQMRVLLQDCVDAIPGHCLSTSIMGNQTLFEEVQGDELDKIVDEVIAANEKAVQEILEGKDKAIGSLIGQVKKRCKADPSEVKDLLIKKIRGT